MNNLLTVLYYYPDIINNNIFTVFTRVGKRKYETLLKESRRKLGNKYKPYIVITPCKAIKGRARVQNATYLSHNYYIYPKPPLPQRIIILTYNCHQSPCTYQDAKTHNLAEKSFFLLVL